MSFFIVEPTDRTMPVLEFIHQIVSRKIKRPPKVHDDARFMMGRSRRGPSSGNRFAFAKFKKMRDKQQNSE